MFVRARTEITSVMTPTAFKKIIYFRDEREESLRIFCAEFFRSKKSMFRECAL